MIYIALAFLIVAFPSLGIWLTFGVGIKKFLKSTKHQKIFNLSMALLLTVSVLPVLIKLVEQYVA